MLAKAFTFSAPDDSAAPLPEPGAREVREKPLQVTGPGGRKIPLPNEVLDIALCTGEDLQAAIDVVLKTATCSISGLQRRLKLGYNGAARRIEAMELLGIVSAPSARGERHVVR
ncbi:DNA translocase FtsK [uncultured Arenimonas sp.]|uniref:DNA translocase FtsK n=1 Tax=uncultured Arenimonas sp. TaxID=546226 RepID=UPI0030DB5633